MGTCLVYAEPTNSFSPLPLFADEKLVLQNEQSKLDQGVKGSGSFPSSFQLWCNQQGITMRSTEKEILSNKYIGYVNSPTTCRMMRNLQWGDSQKL